MRLLESVTMRRSPKPFNEPVVLLQAPFEPNRELLQDLAAESGGRAMIQIDEELIIEIARETRTQRAQVLRRIAGFHIRGPAAYAIDRALADRGIVPARVVPPKETP